MYEYHILDLTTYELKYDLLSVTAAVAKIPAATAGDGQYQATTRPGTAQRRREVRALGTVRHSWSSRAADLKDLKAIAML